MANLSSAFKEKSKTMVNTQCRIVTLSEERRKGTGREVAMMARKGGQVSFAEMLHSWKRFVSYLVQKMTCA